MIIQDLRNTSLLSKVKIHIDTKFILTPLKFVY